MMLLSISKMIETQLCLAEDLWMINGNPSQIEQILMNLVINAMDAMSDGGKLIINTRNIVLDEESCRHRTDAKPGRYALMEVSDTGKGMDYELTKHIFDPLFTTKEPGKGTGLGLTVVHGLV